MKAWCPQCRHPEYVNTAWRCLWCGVVTLGMLNEAEAKESRTLTPTQIREAHERYALGEPFRPLARAYFTGRDTLRQNFWHAGLPTRTVKAANTLAAPRKRHAVRHAEDNPAYRHDLADAAVVEAYERLGSLALAARDLGCGIGTVHRRLKLLGVERHPRAYNRGTRLRGAGS